MFVDCGVDYYFDGGYDVDEGWGYEVDIECEYGVVDCGEYCGYVEGEDFEVGDVVVGEVDLVFLFVYCYEDVFEFG